MKAISSSIIVLSAAFLLIGGAYLRNDSGIFLTFVGCVVGLFGMCGWFVSFKDK